MAKLLECVSRMGSVEEVRNLLELGNSDVNYRDALGWTALHYCYGYGKSELLVNDGIEVVRLLIQHGTDVNAMDINNHCTPVMLFLFNVCPLDFILLLLDNNADVNSVDTLGNVALYYFLEYYMGRFIDPNLFDRLIPRQRLNSKNCKGETPLMAAVRRGCSKECIRALLTAGSDPRIPYNYFILHTHVIGYKPKNKDSAEVLKQLVDSGAIINCVDGQGFTPLMLFLHLGHSCIDHARTYINKGAIVNITDGQGNTPLHKATHSSDLCELFLDCGLDPNKKNFRGDTPLTIAMGHSLRSVCDSVRTLVNYGAKIDMDCVMISHDEVTKQIVKLSSSMLLSHYLMNKSTDTDARYENIFKHMFLANSSIFNQAIDSRNMMYSKLMKFVLDLYLEEEKMKIFYLKRGITLADFLREADQTKYVAYFENCEDVDAMFLDDHFPQYSEIIKSKIRVAKRMSEFQKKLESLSISTMVNGKEIKLNTYCVRHLLKFLQGYHLHKLTEASTNAECA